MTYQEIKAFINTYIVQNGVNAITGSQLNTALNALADYYGFDSVTVTTLPAGSDATVNVQGRTLELGIPKGAAGEDGRDGRDGRDGLDAVNPFKGWFNSLDDLKASYTASVGDSAYVKDASPATTWSIYIYDSTASSDNYWGDSGIDADTSNVQTFASGEEVNEVHIVNDLTTGGIKNVLSAEQGKNFNEKLFGKQITYTDIAVVGQDIYGSFSKGTKIEIDVPQLQGSTLYFIIYSDSTHYESKSLVAGEMNTILLDYDSEHLKLYKSDAVTNHWGADVVIYGITQSQNEKIETINESLQDLSTDVESITSKQILTFENVNKVSTDTTGEFEKGMRVEVTASYTGSNLSILLETDTPNSFDTSTVVPSGELFVIYLPHNTAKIRLHKSDAVTNNWSGTLSIYGKLLTIEKHVDDIAVDVVNLSNSVNALNSEQEYTFTDNTTRATDITGAFQKGQKIKVVADSYAGTYSLFIIIRNEQDTNWDASVIIPSNSTYETYLEHNTGKIRLYKNDANQAGCSWSGTMNIYGIIGALFQKVDGLEEMIDNIDVVGFYTGKKLVTLGDSYCATGQWQAKLVDLKGFAFDSTLNNGNYSVAASQTLNQSGECGQERAKKLVEDGLIVPDVIMLENVNDWSHAQNNLGTLADEPYFIGTKQILSVSGLASKSAAKQYFIDNINTILNNVTPEHGYRVEIPYSGGDTATIFTFNSAPSQNGVITIKYGPSYKYINIESTDSISDVIAKIVENHYNNFVVESTSNTVKFSPAFSGISASLFGNTSGMSITESTNQPSTLVVIMTYPLHDNTQLEFVDSTNWVELSTVTMWSAYKGLFNYLSQNFPNAEVFWIAPIAYEVDVNSSAFQYEDGTLDTDKVIAGIKFTELKESQKTICEKCRVPLFDLEKYACIYPSNVANYFPANNYHPNAKGYERWGIAVASFLL